ncbi:replicative DNA helicase [Corynebacterium kroppenstedtii]|uniref:replicative DNA helicase n=1 Tax=Corynebacterium sp. PCR 32 TaxID=3351342 RepID=UPI0030A46017
MTSGSAVSPSFDHSYDSSYEPGFNSGGSYDDVPFEHSDGPETRGYEEFGRKSPQDIDAEQAVLGGMLQSQDAITDVVEVLRAEDFYDPRHQTVFNAILDLYSEAADAQLQIDPVLVSNRLHRDGDLERVGGAPYIHTLMTKVPTAANAGYYARIVAEKAVLRGLVSVGTEIVKLGYNGIDGQDVDKVVDYAQSQVFGVGRRNASTDYVVLADTFEDVNDLLNEYEAHGGIASGVPTGFFELDKTINGLHPGQMIIIAARPGVGKSTLAMDFMRSVSVKNDTPSALFSLEMSKTEIVLRLLSAEAEVNLGQMRSGKMDEAEWTRLAQTMGKLEKAPIFIDDSPNLTMMEIRTKARQMKQKHGLGLIVVDYLQLMTSGRKVESRQQEVSEFSRQLKLLAKEVDVPLIAISQLNRGPESRTDKRPQLADLRESGSLEQDADMVMLLYRPNSQPDALDNPREGEADIILAKHRGGPVGTFAIAEQLHYSRFANLATEHFA